MYELTPSLFDIYLRYCSSIERSRRWKIPYNLGEKREGKHATPSLFWISITHSHVVAAVVWWMTKNWLLTYVRTYLKTIPSQSHLKISMVHKANFFAKDIRQEFKNIYRTLLIYICNGIMMWSDPSFSWSMILDLPIFPLSVLLHTLTIWLITIVYTKSISFIAHEKFLQSPSLGFVLCLVVSISKVVLAPVLFHHHHLCTAVPPMIV